MSVIELQGLSKRYGKTIALDNLTLKLDAGAPIALIGPNGAGKTTFLSLLSGFIMPTQGSAIVLGHTPGSAELQGQLSALPQDAMLDPRFAVTRQLNFLARLQGLSGSAAKKEVDRVLDLVQLRESGVKKPAELSHGMRKRISIAQMLLGSPKLALMDEPTAGLDPPNVKMIRELIAENAQRTTFIISSHNLDELEKVCSSVVYLENGQLREHASIDQLDRDSGYITIRLSKVDHQEFTQSAQALFGVTAVTRKQQDDFLIAYDSSISKTVDQALLQLLAERNWHYRHMINGRTLEEKMF